MRISVKQTGGFAGLSQDVAAVDTASLDPEAVRSIEQMVQALGFFDLPVMVGSSVGADHFLHEVTVADEKRQHTVSFVKDDESPATEGLRRFVARVQTVAAG